MIKYNKRNYQESLDKAKNTKKHIHTASIHLKPNDSCSDAYYLPLRETVNKKIDEKSNRSFMKSKSKDKNLKMDKSSSYLKASERDKENYKEDKGVGYKFKILQESMNKIETDRKNIMGNASKTMRLKTDYVEELKNEDLAEATKGGNSHKIVKVPLAELEGFRK